MFGLPVPWRQPATRYQGLVSIPWYTAVEQPLLGLAWHHPVHATPLVEGRYIPMALPGQVEIRLQNRYTPVRIRSSPPHNWLNMNGFWDLRSRRPFRLGLSHLGA